MDRATSSFAPTTRQFYFDALPGREISALLPNVADGLKGSDVRESVAAFYDTVLNGPSSGRLFLDISNRDGSILVRTSHHPNVS